MYYPDVMVVCDPEDVDELIVSRPCLVVEVISPSTQLVDRREKLFFYRQIESLDGYLIVEQDERRVIYHSRSAGEGLGAGGVERERSAQPHLPGNRALTRSDLRGYRLAVANKGCAGRSQFTSHVLVFSDARR